MTILPNSVEEIPLDQITTSEHQSRQRVGKMDEDDDLVHSIRKVGLLSPVIVCKIEQDKYELLAGQRRYQAHVILNKPTIRAHVIKEILDKFETKKISLIENTARKDMKHADYVDSIKFFMDEYGKAKTVAEELGLSLPTVYKYLRRDRLPASVKEQVDKGVITLDDAIKSMDIFGSDSNSDDNKIIEIAKQMKGMGRPSKTKLQDILKNKPDLTITDASDMAKKRTREDKIIITVTDDQLTRINKFKDQKGIAETEDAAGELVDLGLQSADV